MKTFYCSFYALLGAFYFGKARSKSFPHIIPQDFDSFNAGQNILESSSLMMNMIHQRKESDQQEDNETGSEEGERMYDVKQFNAPRARKIPKPKSISNGLMRQRTHEVHRVTAKIAVEQKTTHDVRNLMQDVNEPVRGVHVLMQYGEGLSWCSDCVPMMNTGSRIDTWEAEHALKGFAQDGKVVYSIPNDANDLVMNWKEMKGNVGLVDRGGIPIAQKAANLQRAGAVAAIIIDTGECLSVFRCGRLGTKPADGAHGFAALDRQQEWDHIKIPVVLIHKKDGKRLREAMDLVRLEMPGYGVQLVHRQHVEGDG